MSDTIYCMNHPVLTAVNGNKRLPLCEMCLRDLAASKETSAKTASKPVETTVKDGSKVRQHKDSEGNLLTIKTDSAGNVSVSQGKPEDAPPAKPSYAGENDFGPEIIPAMILIRGKNREECEGKARQFKVSLRAIKVDFLPRAVRNRKDAVRAKNPDLITGAMTQDLDPNPWAAWVPMDFESKKKDSRAQFERIAVLIKDPFPIKAETPPDRCNPTLWSESDYHGAEVIDLRNYPGALRANMEFIKNSIKEARGWQSALRSSVDARNGQPVWATLPESCIQRWDVRDVNLGIDKSYRPGKIATYRNPEFDHGPRRNAGN